MARKITHTKRGTFYNSPIGRHKVGKTSANVLGGLLYCGISAIFSSPKGSSTRKRRTSPGSYTRSSYGSSSRRVERQWEKEAKRLEMEARRAERERAKAERERERVARLQAKQEEQKRFEEEVACIEEENDLWINVHRLINKVVTIEDIKDLLSKFDYEQKNDIIDGFFEKEYPSEAEARQTAQLEADLKYNVEKIQHALDMTMKESSLLHFDQPEPTKETVRNDLIEEAKQYIKAFLPWKQYKLRKEYVADHLENRYDKEFKEWSEKRNNYLSQKKKYSQSIEDLQKKLNHLIDEREKYIANRTFELLDNEIAEWKDERDSFFESLRNKAKNVIDGNHDYVLSTISEIVEGDDLPMEYFVDIVYEEETGKVMVDLDLPEIEEIPTKKIALTPTGKKSIRSKSQTDLKSDYASCVFGLSMYVAYQIFNVSLKVKEIEMTGFTQRQSSNSAIPEDQYVFVINFTRELFSSIDFGKLSSFQIMKFFKHYFNMTKSYDLKQIDISKAFEKMEECIPINYQTYISSIDI